MSGLPQISYKKVFCLQKVLSVFSKFYEFNQNILSHIIDFGFNPENGLWEASLDTIRRSKNFYKKLSPSEKSKFWFLTVFLMFSRITLQNLGFWVQSKLQLA